MTLLGSVIDCLRERGKKPVTLGEMVACAEHDRRQVLRVMDKLAREGYLKEIADNPEPLRSGEYGPPRRNPTWRVVGDLDKRPTPNRPKSQSQRAKIWKLIRAKHRFTKSDLVIPSGATPGTVDRYVRKLEKHGYVRRTGKDGRSTTYMLVNLKQIDPPAGLFGGDS